MGIAGLVFAAVGALWLLYLVPLFLNREENGLLDEVEPGDPITPSVTIVRRGVPLEPAEDAVDLTTESGRRRALQALDVEQQSAARRRQTVLAVLAAVTVASLFLAGAGSLPRWSVLLPLAGLGGFAVLARRAVTRMHAELDARAAAIHAAGEQARVEAVENAFGLAETDDEEHSVEIGAPIEAVSSLWDPVPITKPTYVSAPLAPRTVRTIDLSAPLPNPLGGIPVTADAPVAEPEQQQSAPWGIAVNQ